MEKTNKFINHLNNIEEYLLIGSLMFSVALIGLQVTMRYVVQNSLSWTEELARYIFIWQAWVGASYATKMEKHLRITIIYDSIRNAKVKAVYDLVIHVLWLTFTIFLSYQGCILASKLYHIGQISPAMEILILIPYSAVPVGCTAMSLRLMINICNRLKNFGQIEVTQ